MKFQDFNHITVENVDSIFETIPASIYCKNKKGSYLDCNNMFITVSNSQSKSDVLGYSDFDLIWKKDAAIMYQNDFSVIESNISKSFVEQANKINKEQWYLSYKTPLRSNMNSKKILGVIGFSFPLDADILKNHLNKVMFNSKDEIISTLSEQKNNLTKRQVECLHYLASGMTMKQIAKILSLSPKTIEHHLEAIKNKLGIFTKYELIQFALKAGCKL